jgi:hypothetical protein
MAAVHMSMNTTQTLSNRAIRTLTLQMNEAIRQANEPGTTAAARKCCLETVQAVRERLAGDR